MKGYLIGAITGFILSILGNLLATWIQQELLQNIFTPTSIVFIISCTILGIIIGARLENQRSVPSSSLPKRKSDILYWTFTGVISITIIIFGLIVIFSGNFRSKPLTLYFVIDATEKMAIHFNNVQTQVQIATSGLNGDTRIGLRVFGGEAGNLNNCQDSYQAVASMPYEEGRALLASSLNDVTPQGHSSITGAILKTLLFDLKKETRRSVRVIIITSGLDNLCDPPSGDLITEIATKQNVDLIIVSIGEQNEQNIKVFESYAEAFKGSYIPISSTENLSPIFQQLSLYGYGYSPAYPFSKTSTP